MGKLKVICLAALMLLAACDDPKSAKRVVEGAGYTDVQTTGYSWFGCRDEWYHTGFRAKDAKGRPVSGTVCEGLMFRGSYIRMD